MLHMQDISNWQGPHPAVVTHEVLAIKATEGTTFEDPDFITNWHYAKQNEVARIAYHFFHPSLPAITQVNFFLALVEKAGLETGDMFALDLEVSDGLNTATVAEAAYEFCKAVDERTHASTWVYTDLFFADAGNTAKVGNQPLWIADPSSPPGQPRIPEPWKSLGEPWTAHQFGVVRGIDADLVNVATVSQLAKFGALVPPAPDPNNVVITLHDGDTNHTSTEEFNQTTMLAQLVGRPPLVAGNATLTFTKS